MALEPFKGSLDPDPQLEPFTGLLDGQEAKTTAGDVVKSGLQGVAEGVGLPLQFAGNILAQVGNRAGRAAGYEPDLRAQNPLQGVVDYLERSKTPGGRAAVERSTPAGDVLSPSTWSLGEDPSVGGYLQNIARVAGQFSTPLGVAGAGRILKAGDRTMDVMGAAAGAAQAGGAAGGQEGERIRTMSDADLQALPGFQDYVARGVDPTTARERLAQDVELSAGVVGAIPAAIEGPVVQRLLRGKALLPTVGKSAPTRIMTAGAAGAVGEGIQEATETVAQNLGVNLATGEGRALTEDTFGSAILGAAGGKLAGAGIQTIREVGAPRNAGTDPVAAERRASSEPPTLFPFQSESAAQKRAAAKSETTGEPYSVIPHPSREGRFAVVPQSELRQFTEERTDDALARLASQRGRDEGGMRDFTPPAGTVFADYEPGVADPERIVASINGTRKKPMPPTHAEVVRRIAAGEFGEPQGLTVDELVERGVKRGTAIAVLDSAKKAMRGLVARGQLAKEEGGADAMAPDAGLAAPGVAGEEAGGAVAPGAAAVEAQAGARGGPESAVPAAAPVTAVDAAAHEAASSPMNDLPEPTQAQRSAGNYKKGHLSIQGLNLSIENPAGSTRSGVDREGRPWETTLAHHYGYIKRTEGADGDHVDAFVGPNPASGKVFVVDQIDPGTGKFDEHKVLIGFDGMDEAREAYHANYQPGWRGMGAITETTVDDFKTWLEHDTTTKPFGDLKEGGDGAAQDQAEALDDADGRGVSRRADEAGAADRGVPSAGEDAVANAAAAEELEYSAKPRHEMTREEYRAFRRQYEKLMAPDAEPTDNHELDLQHQDFMESALEAGREVPAEAYLSQPEVDAEEYPLLAAKQRESFDGPEDEGEGDLDFTRPPTPPAERPHAFKFLPASGGLSILTSRAVNLGRPRLAETQPNPAVAADRGKVRVAFDILNPQQYKDALDEGLTSDEAHELAKKGELLINLKGQVVTDFYNIKVFEKRRGWGEKVVRALLDTNAGGEPMHVHQIEHTDEAMEFWVNMGARFPRTQDDQEADLTVWQYREAAKRRGKNEVRPETREGNDAGREARARGDAAPRAGEAEREARGQAAPDGRGDGEGGAQPVAPPKTVAQSPETPAPAGVSASAGPDEHSLDGEEYTDAHAAADEAELARQAKTHAERGRIADGTKRAGDTAKPALPEKAVQSASPDLDAFTAGMTPMQRARALKSLRETMTQGGEVKPRHAIVADMVKAGATVVPHPKDGRRLQRPGGEFVEEKRLTKTGMDFAEHLAGKDETPAPPNVESKMIRDFAIDELDGFKKGEEVQVGKRAGTITAFATAVKAGKGAPRNRALVRFAPPGESAHEQFHDLANLTKKAAPDDPGTPKPALVRVTDVYGRDHWVTQADLDNTARTQLRRHRPGGERIAGETIHRENLDPDGSKRAEIAKTTRIIAAGMGDKPFKTKASLKAAVRKQGAVESDFDVKEVQGGYIAVRREGGTAPPAAEPATHLENGRIAPAKPEIIRESIAKSAANTPLNLKEAKANLLAMIDEAAKKAKTLEALEARRNVVKKDGLIDRIEIQKYRMAEKKPFRAAGWHALTKEELAAEIGYVTLEVPGDGRFKVLNTKEHLAQFRQRVERSSGFTEAKPKKPEKFTPPGKTVPTTIAEMFEDGEYTAAHELAKANGSPFRFGSAEGEHPIVYTGAADVDLPGGLKAFVGRALKDTGKGGLWHAIETSTGLSVVTGDSAEDVRAKLKSRLDPEGVKLLAEKVAEKPKASQEELEARWLEWAETNSEAIADANARRAHADQEHKDRLRAERDLFERIAGEQYQPESKAADRVYLTPFDPRAHDTPWVKSERRYGSLHTSFDTKGMHDFLAKAGKEGALEQVAQAFEANMDDERQQQGYTKDIRAAIAVARSQQAAGTAPEPAPEPVDVGRYRVEPVGSAPDRWKVVEIETGRAVRSGFHSRDEAIVSANGFDAAYQARWRSDYNTPEKPAAVTATEKAEEPARPASKAPRAKKPDPMAVVREHFAPGNIVYSGYWKTHDRVLQFVPDHHGPGVWGVQVEKVEKQPDGTWKAVEPPRWHATRPELNKPPGRNDEVVERAPAAQPATGPSPPPAPASKSAAGMLGAHDALFERLRAGEATLEELRAGFQAVLDGKEALYSELGKLTKDQLAKRMGGRYSSQDTKPRMIRQAYDDLLHDFVLGQSLSYDMMSGPLPAIKSMVAKYTPESITDYAARVKAAREERAERLKGLVSAIENPQTLDDFTTFIRARGEGALTPEQRRVYEDLRAAQSLEARLAAAERKSQVQAVGQTVGSEIIETKHTQKGHDLFVVQLAERVERDIYNRLNTEAKRLGGYYSAFRGRGAVPGFQFKTRDAAEAFKALASEGDTEAATAAVQARREERAEAVEGNAVERLRAMADKLEGQGEESLGADRLANTARRARQAASAEQGARVQIQLAKTMRNLADAIESGAAKFLAGIRTKAQVTMLNQAVAQAHADRAREITKGKDNSAFERESAAPITEETADYIKWPRFTMRSSDIEGLAARLKDVPGMMRLADGLRKAAQFRRAALYSDAVAADSTLRHKVLLTLQSGEPAIVKNKEVAVRAAARSSLGAMVVSQGRTHYIVLSPERAIEARAWSDPDPMLSLSDEVGKELADKLARYNAGKGWQRQITAGWWLPEVAARQKRLQAMGIVDDATYRAAAREFIKFRAERPEENRVRELERALAGRKDVGFDFFPTPVELAERMAEALDVQPGMRVLEPSAGKGNLADAVRDAQPEAKIEVVEQSSTLREILDAKGYELVGQDFNEFTPREGFTYGDIFRAPDGQLGIMRGHPGGPWGGRVSLVDSNGRGLGYFDRTELEPVEKRGGGAGYDRIIMNPPFSNGIDADHVRRAYDLLNPGGRLVAITGEGIFFRGDAKAQAFRQWFDVVGGTSEKLEGAFLDKREVATTGVNSRMLVIDKPGEPAWKSESLRADLESARQIARGEARSMMEGALKAFDEGDRAGAADLVGRAMRTTYFDEFQQAAAGLAERLAPPKQSRTGRENMARLDSAMRRMDEMVSMAEKGRLPDEYATSLGEVPWAVQILGEDPRRLYITGAVVNKAVNGKHRFSLTPDMLRQIPAQLLEPAMIFESRTQFGSLVIVTELVERTGEPIVVPIKLEATVGRITATVITSVHGRADGQRQLEEWAKQGLLLYYDKSKTATPSTTSRLQLPSVVQLGVAANPSVKTDEDVVNRFGAMFSRARRTAGAAQGLTRAAVQRALDPLTAQWTNAPTIRIVDSAADMPVPVAEDAAGAFHEGAVYLIAQNLSSPAHAQFVALHEAAGHYGLLGTLGPRLEPIMLQVYRTNENVRALADRWMRDNPRAPDQSEQSYMALAAEEALADLAGSGLVREQGFWRWLVAAVRHLLRNLGFDLTVTDTEVAVLLADAKRFVEGGSQAIPTQPALAKLHKAYHGSPHDFDAFSTAHVGSGEGAQAYGWGLYFAGKRAVAEWYKNKLSGRMSIDDLTLTKDGATLRGREVLTEFYRPGAVRRTNGGGLWDQVVSYNPEQGYVTVRRFADKALTRPDYGNTRPITYGTQFGWTSHDVRNVASQLEAEGWKVQAGRLYEVELAPKDDEYLSWDSLMDEQGEPVLAALRKSDYWRYAEERIEAAAERRGATPTGADLYRDLLDDYSPKEASLFLKSLGIPGIKYLDGSSRGFAGRGVSYRVEQIGDKWAAVKTGQSVGPQHTYFDTEAEAREWVDEQQAGRHNYVIFDDADVKIEAKMSRSGAPLDLRTVAPALAGKLNDVMRTQRKFNWWRRTIGTQYDKAEASPFEFKPVFEAAQRFVQDTSLIATEAADLAPDILPKLESLKGAAKDLFNVTGVKAHEADMKAVAVPVFKGTLVDNRVYTAEELRSEFKLTQRQVELYQQARAAIDKSLDLLAASEMAQQARIYGLPRTIEVAKRQPTLTDALATYRDALQSLARMSPESTQKQIAATVATLENIHDHAQRMKQEGYAPLMRFGQHYVYAWKVVKDSDGKKVRQTAYFALHDNEREANADQRRIAELFAADPAVKLEQGILSAESYKLFKGVSPETLALFADALGKPQDEATQAFYRLAVSQRSALKRLIHRKGSLGFSEDVARTLATFVTSNARMASKNYHMGELRAKVEDIKSGDVKDDAVQLMDYLDNPTEEAAKFRGFLFIQYLGGSIASAAVNASQSVTMTFPYLAQFVPAAESARLIARGAQVALGRAAGSDELAAAMKRAAEEGITEPAEIHQLYAESMRGFGSNIYWRRFLRLWGSAFQLAEAFNRKTAFAAAFEIGSRLSQEALVQAGVATPYEFAAKAVHETQGIYNRANRPNWARGVIGSTLFTFKQFSVHYLEWLMRLPPKQRALALAVLLLSAGVQGLPFADDLEDLADTAAESLGYNWQSEQALHEFLAESLGLGSGIANWIQYGSSTIPGVPLDIQARMGLGNLIPGTALFRKSAGDKSREALEVFGPAGGLIKSGLEAFGALQSGSPFAAAAKASPVAIQNLAKAADMVDTGMYRDARNRKVIDVDGLDAAVKAIGFQPAAVAAEQRAVGRGQQAVGLTRTVEAEIAGDWAAGVFERDPAQVQRAKERLARWNEDNPTTPIRITSQQIMQRVRQMQLTRTQRAIKAAPAEMRGEVQKTLFDR